MAYTVVLTLAADGREYNTRADAQAVVDRFGATPDQVREVVDPGGRPGLAWEIVCEQQRGPRGAHALHGAACAHGLLAHLA